MKEYTYTKLIGVIVGTLTMIGSIGFAFLSLLGRGLSRALNSSIEPTSTDKWVLVLPAILLVMGLITAIGAFRLKRQAGQIFYTVFCFLLGIGFISTFFIAFGALGSKNEFFLLCVGLIYVWLGYLAKKKK